MVDNGENGHDQKRARFSDRPDRPWEDHHSRPQDSKLPAIQSPSISSPANHLPPPFTQSQSQHPLPHLVDRRHSEHVQYDPVHSRRPGSGHSPHGYQQPRPSSALYSAAQTEGPIVKRDPDEQMQFRPPPTTHNGQEHNMGAPHHERHPPLFEHPPASAAPFRSGYQQSSQSPMSATEPYNNSGYPPNVPQFPGVSYPSNSNVIKRKATRAAQACDNCRALKAKCDEGRPMCSSCKEKGSQCVYRDPPPKQQDRTSIDILESLTEFKTLFANLQTSVGNINDVVKGVQGDMTVLSDVVKGVQGDMTIMTAQMKAMRKSMNTGDVQVTVKEEVSEKSLVPDNLTQSSSTHASPTSPGSGQDTSPTAAEPEGGTDDEEAGPTVLPGPSSIPMNHTTGAARLLNVGPIKKLCEALINKRPRLKNENWPMLLEEKRGLLRVHGRGEGIDRPPGYEKDQQLDMKDIESTPSEANSDSGLSPPGEEWGPLPGLTPPAEPPPYPPDHQHSPRPATMQISVIANGSPPSEINSEGMPPLGRQVVERLVKSYMDNINNMHPLLVPQQVNALVERFLRSIPESHAKQVQQTPSVAAGFMGSEPVSRPVDSSSNKRKQPGDPPAVLRITDQIGKPGHPYRSITTGLVLIIMALGKVCEHRKQIPEVLPARFENDPDNLRASNSPTMRNGVPRSPFQSSPKIPSSTGLPSPQDAESARPHSRKSSLDGVDLPLINPKARNRDVIPGLAYFALATDIIGNQLGGNSLQHVHVNILAGLYHGQLGRVLESHAYIHQACRSLLVILRPKLDRFRRLKKEMKAVRYEDNPLVFAFWTCLQLESDIVAELPCPHSGILQHEDNMPPPNLQVARDKAHFNFYALESYSAQLYLRKHLNELHNMFYSPDSESNKASHFPTIEAVEEHLNLLKKSAPNMMWEEDDPPAQEILGARLRAKFYGARVITYRYFVLKILEQSEETSGNLLESFKSGISVPSIDHNARNPVDPKVLKYAELCIEALFKSTTAFHGLGDLGSVRLLVTNIWGTAHAQWGNVLTLIAASRHPILEKFINQQDLKDLFHKTVSFLRFNKHKSSTLQLDYEILRHIGHEVGYTKSSPSNLNTSFDSHASEDVVMSGH